MFRSQLEESSLQQMHVNPWVGGSPPPTKENPNVDESTTIPEAKRPVKAADDFSYIAKRLKEIIGDQPVEPEAPANPIPVVDYNAYCCD